MFEVHPNHFVPLPTQRVWRYLAADRLLDLLNTGELYFTNLTCFADSLEGSLTGRTRAGLADSFIAHGSSPEQAASEVKMYEGLTRTYYANCWHMNEHESSLMWRGYANRGFAIGSTWGRLTEAVAGTPLVIYGSVVHYIDFDTVETNSGNTFDHVVMKDLPYTDEREVRLIYWNPAILNPPIKEPEKGVRVKVDLGRLIESISIDPSKPNIAPELLEKFVELGLAVQGSKLKYRARAIPN